METNKSNFRSKVMNHAWQIFKTTGQVWKECMKLAWRLYRLAKRMKTGVVKFLYKKADGSVRQALGTTHDIPYTANPRKKAGVNFKTLTYFDVDKNAFRSFRIENYIAML